MAAGRLDVLLGLDAAEFTSGLTKAEYDAKKFRDNLDKLASQVGKVLGAGFVAAATGAAFLTRSALDAQDKLLDLSATTGVTVENLGGIGFAASQAGSSLDAAASSFGKLNLKISEAARDTKSEAAEAFRLLGVSVTDAAGKTRAGDAVFRDLASAFEGYAEGPEKAALANAVFSKRYEEMMPLLVDGGKNLQANIDYYNKYAGITTETATAASTFNDTLGKLKVQTEALGNALVRELIGPLQVVADEMLRSAESSSAFDSLAKGARVAFETIAILYANVEFVFKGVGREIAAVAAQMVALATLDLDAFRAISDAVKEDGVRARAELDALERRILGLAAGPSLASRIGTANPDRELERLNRPKTTAPRLPGAGSPGGKSAKQAIDDSAQAYARYVDELARGLEREEQLSRVQEVTRAIEQNRFGTLIPQQKELLLLLAQQIDANEEYGQKIAHNARLEKEYLDTLQREQDILNRLTGRAVLEQQAEQLRILNDAAQRGAITWEEYNRGLDEVYGKLTKDIGKGADAAANAAEELGMVLVSRLGEFFRDPSPKSFFKALTEDVLQFTTKLLILEPLMKSIKAAWGEGGTGSFDVGSLFKGSGTDWLGKVFSGAGDWFKGLVGSFAGGTDFVPRDGLAMVHRGEKIVTAADNRRDRTGPLVGSIVNNWPAGTTRETAAQAGAAFARQLATVNRRYN